MNQPPPSRPPGGSSSGDFGGGYSGGRAQPRPPQYQSTYPPRPAKDSEQLLAEALRAMASGAASMGSGGSGSASPGSNGPVASRQQAPIKGWTELALLCGIVGLTIGIIVGLASYYW